MKIIRIWFLLALFVGQWSSLYSQDSIVNCKNFIYNRVYKNIVAYNIRYASFSFNGIIVHDTFRSNADFFYEHLLPNDGYKLKMDIQQLDLSYPIAGFRLFKITTNYFDFTTNKEEPEMSSLGPILNNLFLLAVNINNGDVKFISGQFFKSELAEDFKLDVNNPEGFIPYLTLRSFNVGSNKLTFLKKKHKKLYYEGYSDLYKTKLRVEVDKNNLENPKIIIDKAHL